MMRHVVGLGLDDDEILPKDKNGWMVLEVPLCGGFSWLKLEAENVLDAVRAPLEQPSSSKRLLAAKPKNRFNVPPAIFYFSNVHQSASVKGAASTSMWLARILQALVDAIFVVGALDAARWLSRSSAMSGSRSF